MEKTYEPKGSSDKIPILKWGFSAFGFIFLLLSILLFGMLIIFSFQDGTISVGNTDYKACVWLLNNVTP